MNIFLVVALAAPSGVAPPYQGIAAPCATYRQLIDSAATDFSEIKGNYRASLDFAAKVELPRASRCLITDDHPHPIFRCNWEFPKSAAGRASAMVTVSALVQDLSVCPLDARFRAEIADGIEMEVPGKASIRTAFVGNDEIGWTAYFEMVRQL